MTRFSRTARRGSHPGGDDYADCGNGKWYHEGKTKRIEKGLTVHNRC
jgi:hypothetical protein